MRTDGKIQGMVLLSVPFCAGAGAGVSLPIAISGGTAWYCAGASLAASAFLLAAYSITRRRSLPAVALLYLLLGLFCSLSHRLMPGVGQFPSEGGYAARCMASFQRAIRAVPYSSEGTTGILLALLTGDRSGLDPAVTEAFRKSGAAHILALSGLHLGIVYGIATKILSVLGNTRTARTVRAAAAVTLAGFYTLMTGAGPSIQRAFLFITMNEILRLCPGRKRVPVNILCTALTIQLCINPMIIRSLGFQLSYLSMTGIMTVFPILEGWYPKSGKKDPVRAVWVSAALSISCQIFTAPLVWIRFGTFPVYFLLTNLISLPLTEALIVSGLAATTLNAAGICPAALVDLTERICQSLTFSLGTISLM